MLLGVPNRQPHTEVLPVANGSKVSIVFLYTYVVMVEFDFYIFGDDWCSNILFYHRHTNHDTVGTEGILLIRSEKAILDILRQHYSTRSIYTINNLPVAKMNLYVYTVIRFPSNSEAESSILILLCVLENGTRYRTSEK